MMRTFALTPIILGQEHKQHSHPHKYRLISILLRKLNDYPINILSTAAFFGESSTYIITYIAEVSVKEVENRDDDHGDGD